MNATNSQSVVLVLVAFLVIEKQADAYRRVFFWLIQSNTATVCTDQSYRVAYCRIRPTHWELG